LLSPSAPRPGCDVHDSERTRLGRPAADLDMRRVERMPDEDLSLRVAVTLKKQALHDFTARTLVVDGRPVPGGSLELWRIVAAFGIPFLWFLVTFVAVFRSLNS
jgi:hypothetical protein